MIWSGLLPEKKTDFMTPRIRHIIKHRLRYPLEALLAHGFFSLSASLPIEAASNLGGMIGRIIGPMLSMTDIARDNLDHFMPSLSHNQRDEVVLEMWDNLGRVMAEYPHLNKIGHDNRYLEIVGSEAAIATLKEHPNSIFFSGHLANWEVFRKAAEKLSIPITMIYRKPNNQRVEELLMRARGGNKESHIAKGHIGARQAVAVLKNKHPIGMLVDQKLNEGLAIPFFGRPAMTAPAIAHFALRYGCPVIPARVERLSGPQFQLTLYPALWIDKECHPDVAVEKMLVEINKLLEGWIRENPGQWLWAHRRWGHL